jgi:hypothetical protein
VFQHIVVLVMSMVAVRGGVPQTILRRPPAPTAVLWSIEQFVAVMVP